MWKLESSLGSSQWSTETTTTDRAGTGAGAGLRLGAHSVSLAICLRLITPALVSRIMGKGNQLSIQLSKLASLPHVSLLSLPSALRVGSKLQIPWKDSSFSRESHQSPMADQLGCTAHNHQGILWDPVFFVCHRRGRDGTQLTCCVFHRRDAAIADGCRC